MTPCSARASTIGLQVDGQRIAVPQGLTLLQACAAAGRDLPTLCFVDGLSAVGACRLCLVTLAGQARPVTACTTEAEAGMVVDTTGVTLELWRRLAVELLFQEGNHVCAFCIARGHCELQSLAARFGIDHFRYPARRPLRDVDASHPRFLLDHNVCILCSRCVRVCAELKGAHVWELAERGARTRLVAGLDQPWGHVDACTGCGKCVQLCPTGALAEKGLGSGEKRPDPALAARLRPSCLEPSPEPPTWGPMEEPR
ncbi:MAG: 2Fe-2S iron-sulfur cluster-binding protein [Cyanobacteriota bacterium]